MASKVNKSLSFRVDFFLEEGNKKLNVHCFPLNEWVCLHGKWHESIYCPCPYPWGKRLKGKIFPLGSNSFLKEYPHVCGRFKLLRNTILAWSESVVVLWPKPRQIRSESVVVLWPKTWQIRLCIHSSEHRMAYATFLYVAALDYFAIYSPLSLHGQ